MAFTKHEKTRIAHFLGYAHMSQLSASIQLGVPAGSQFLFVYEDALTRLFPEAEETVRKDLCQCEAIEAQMGDARSRYKASAVGELKMNPLERIMLMQDLEFWTDRLSTDVGAPRNPYASNAGYAPGGRNAVVVG